MPNLIHVAIIGASGYTGIELVRLLHSHPDVNIAALAAESNAGKHVDDIYTHLFSFDLPKMVCFEQINWEKIDVAFCCLPHSTSHQKVAAIPQHVKIIDLSADFRFSDTKRYEETYQCYHAAAKLQEEAAYGLTELFKSDIRSARIVACPGCYPTSVIIPTYPLIKEKLIDPAYIIADSKSGMSGAGRKTVPANLFSEMNEGVRAYGISTHRHTPEMEMILARAADKCEPCVQFTPQIIPINRGILSNIYVNSDQSVDEIRHYLSSFYEQDPFIQILPDGRAPATRDVYATNQCHIGIFAGRKRGSIVISSVIDNLVKGASGQALQNMNVMFGIEERCGLDLIPVFP